MTAPAERAPPTRRPARDHHLRLPAEHARMRGHARARRGAAGLDDVGHRPHLRGDRRGRAPGAPGDPPRAARAARRARIMVTGCSAQIEPASYAAMAEVDHVIGNAEKLRAGALAEPRRPGAAPARVMVADIMAIRETAGHLIDGLRRPRARVPPGAERLRPSLHLLHHPLWPRPEPQRAGRRGRAAGARAGRGGLPRDRADRGRPDLLRRGFARRAEPRPDGAAPAARRCRSCRGCACRRSTRPRSTATCWALVAGEPRLMPHLHLSLQAGDDLILKRMKRRHSRARRDPPARPAAPACAPGHRVRRRPDRRLPDRERGDVRQRSPWSRKPASPICTCSRIRRAAATPAARMPQLPAACARSARPGCAPRASAALAAPAARRRSAGRRGAGRGARPRPHRSVRRRSGAPARPPALRAASSACSASASKVTRSRAVSAS